MKRSMAWMVSLLVLGTVAYLGSRLGAKPAPPAGAPAPTRVALLNLRWVIKNYTRYQQFMESRKKLENKYTEKLEAKQKQAETLGKQLEDLQGVARTAKEKEIRTLQREIEDVKEQALAELKEKSNGEMVKVYLEIRDAAFAHAKANNIDLVMHFEGAADKEELDSAALITRNMNASGCVPYYWNPAIDISGHVLDALNKSYKRDDK